MKNGDTDTISDALKMFGDQDSAAKWFGHLNTKSDGSSVISDGIMDIFQGAFKNIDADSIKKNIAKGAKAESSSLGDILSDGIGNLVGGVTSFGSGISAVLGSVAQFAIPLILGGLAIHAGKSLWNNVLTNNNANKKYEESSQKYDNAVSERDSLQSEYNTNKERYYELNAKENRSTDEQAELENLASKNSLMESQLKVKDNLVDATQKQQALDAKDALEKSGLRTDKTSAHWYENGLLRGKTGVKYQDDIDEANDMIEKLNRQKAEREELISNESNYSPEKFKKKLASIEDDISTTEGQLTDSVADISDKAQDLWDDNGNLIDESARNTAKRVQQLTDNYKKAVGSTSTTSDKMNNIFALSQFSDLKDKLIAAGKSGGTDTIPAIVAAIQAKDDSDKKTASDKIGNNLNFKSYGNGNLLQNVNPVVMDKYWVPIGINLADINTTQLTYDPTKTPSGAPSYGINRGISLVKKGNGTFGLLQKKISITPDTKYTLSCFVKADAACTFYLGYRANGDNSDFTTKSFTLQQSNNWNLVSYTFSSKNHLIDVCFKSTNTCTFCGMQLELGDSATKFGYFIQSEDTMKSYETDWKLYGIDELETKIETYKNCIEELEKGGLNKPYQTGSGYEQDYANQMYRTYDDYKKLKVQAEAALRERQAEYNKVKAPQDNIQAKRVKFGEAILWNNYGSDFNTKYADCNHNHSYPKFTTEELLILKTLTRQATYTNENIITTSLTTTESAVDKCKELYDDAIDELYAESHPQYEYSDEVENIYALPEFKEYHDQLNINDFIYLEVMDDEYVKLRVTEISYNPCDMDESMELTFTSPTTYKTKRNDFNKILDAAINKSSHDGGTVQGVNKVSDASSYVISSDVIQRLFSNPVFSTKTTNMITGNSGDITANKIVTQLLNADEGVIKKLTSELVYSDYIKAKERYSIYNKSSEEYQDIIWYNQNSGMDFEDGLYIGLMGKIVGTVDPTNAYLKFKDKDDTIYVHGNLDITDNKIQCTELQVLNKISLSGAITMDNNIKNAIKDCHSHNQIQTGIELALHVNSDRIEPYAYDEIAGWHTLGICEYAAASQAPYLGSASNMFQNLYLAGSIKSLGAWNSSISSGSSVYVNKDGIMRKYVASSSSMSIKNHIKEITYDDAKSLLNSRIYSFRYNPEMYSLDEISESKKDRYGFILEDLEKTFPMAVEHDKDGLPTSWCLQIVVPTHLAITKEHEIKITEHEREIEQLKSDNKKLQEEIILLKQQLCKEETHEISENQSER